MSPILASLIVSTIHDPFFKSVNRQQAELCAHHDLDKLLRVRKDLATTFPSAVAQASWARLIKPLFTESQLVMQSLVELRTGNIIPRLNKELESLSRAPKRKGVYLADDDYGLLVTDMTPGMSRPRSSIALC